jgi:hypothetical protein
MGERGSRRRTGDELRLVRRALEIQGRN